MLPKTKSQMQILLSNNKNRSKSNQNEKGKGKGRTISRAQAVGKAARRLPPKSSQAATHMTGGARLPPLASTEYRMAS